MEGSSVAAAEDLLPSEVISFLALVYDIDETRQS